MDSLLLLCARRMVAHHPLPTLPAHLYPVLFQVAFLDGRSLVLRDLVATWPFPVLHFQRLLGHRELLQYHDYKLCVEAIIQAVVAQLVKPGHHSSLRVLDITGLPAVIPTWFSTEVLAKACMEVSRYQQEFQRRRSKRHKGCTGAVTAPPQTSGVDVHADLYVSISCYSILRDALPTGIAHLLRLKCREFVSDELLASQIVTLLESLDPSCLRRVKLWLNKFRLTGLSVILPHLSRFPELRSLSFQEGNVYNLDRMPESADGIRCVARHLGMLPNLRELSLGYSRLSGNLRHILSDLQAPLESLELDCCFLVPADIAFLSQSFHTAALKKLNLSGHNISQGLLEPLQLLLEETSASLLYLELECCSMDNSHLHALLPTLLRCSRLRFLRLYDNPLCMAALKDLLQKTLELPDLKLVVYPQPRDCFRLEPSEFGRDFREVVDEELLAAVTAEISQLLENSGRTDLVWTDNPYGHEGLDYFSL
ncbi:LRC14 protein, partial [Toxostoma redivivum]|nr:LRC14 protein [Toxostoma redivivum]